MKLYNVFEFYKIQFSIGTAVGQHKYNLLKKHFIKSYKTTVFGTLYNIICLVTLPETVKPLF